MCRIRNEELKNYEDLTAEEREILRRLFTSNGWQLFLEIMASRKQAFEDDLKYLEINISQDSTGSIIDIAATRAVIGFVEDNIISAPQMIESISQPEVDIEKEIEVYDDPDEPIGTPQES